MMNVVAIFLVIISADVIDVECKDATVVFINSLADRGLDKLTRKLMSKNIETLDLPDIDYTVREKYPHIRLEMKQGSFGSLYSLKRVGDVVLIMNGNALTVNISATFEKAIFHFKDFKATIGALDLTDELTVFLRLNEIHLQATLLLTEGGFKVSLDDLMLTKFGKIHAERKKKGELQSEATNGILSFAFNKYSEKLRVALSGLLKKTLEGKVLKKFDLM